MSGSLAAAIAAFVARDEEQQNFFQQKASTTEALALDNDHPIRNLSRTGGPAGGELTAAQWVQVVNRIETILQTCPVQGVALAGPTWQLGTKGEVLAALRTVVNSGPRDSWEEELTNTEMAHLAALRWAIATLMQHNMVEPRIQKIVGAGLTTLIQRRVMVGNAAIGIATVAFPVVEANQILTQCMKAYQVLDAFELEDITELGVYEDLSTILGARNVLAGIAMIDMQVDPWVTRADDHLGDVGVATREMHLTERDTMARREMTAPFETQGRVTVRDVLHAYTNNLPHLASDHPYIADGASDFTGVGFAGIGDMRLAHLAPLMFLSAQLEKVRGVPWQVIGDKYMSVWLTAGPTLMRPLPLGAGLQVLKAGNLCAADEDPFRPSAWDIMTVGHMRGLGRPQPQVADNDANPDGEEEEGLLIIFN